MQNCLFIHFAIKALVKVSINKNENHFFISSHFNADVLKSVMQLVT